MDPEGHSGPEQRQTGIGALAKIERDRWEGFCEIGGAEVHILADDVRGEPDPQLLAFLSQSRDKLSDLADLARRELSRISDEHRFGMVSSPNKGGEVCLGFTREEGDWGETVFVEFEGSSIVTWSVTD